MDFVLLGLNFSVYTVRCDYLNLVNNQGMKISKLFKIFTFKFETREIFETIMKLLFLQVLISYGQMFVYVNVFK